MARDQLDQLLNDVCKNHLDQIDELNHIEIPDIEKTMEKLQRRLTSDNSKSSDKPWLPRILHRWGRVSGYALCIILCSFMLSIIMDLPQVEALRFRIIKTMFDIQHNPTVSSSEQSSGEDCIEKLLSLEEAIKELPFPLLISNYIPEGYVINKVVVRRFQSGSYIVSQKYDNKDNEKKGLTIEQLYQPDVEEFASGMVTTGDIKTVTVMGEKALLVTSGSESSWIGWRKGNSKYDIMATISEEEILKMTDHLELKD